VLDEHLQAFHQIVLVHKPAMGFFASASRYLAADKLAWQTCPSWPKLPYIGKASRKRVVDLLNAQHSGVTFLLTFVSITVTTSSSLL
jgi:hypothetical protein